MTPRVVIFRAGALGDTILTMPALAALRRQHPNIPIEVIGHAAFRELGAVRPEHFHSVDDEPFAGFYNDRLPQRLRTWLAGTHRLVVWSSWARGIPLTVAGVEGTIASTPYPPPGVHAASWLLETIGAPETQEADWNEQRQYPPTWLLPLVANDRASARTHLRALGMNRPVVIHPGAGAAWKRWPAQRFIQLAEHLDAAGHDVVVIRGPADADLLPDSEPPWLTLQEPPLWHLAAILAEARLYIGNDSGVTHLAGAVGTPTLTLFGPTDPQSWRPLGSSTVIRICTAVASRQGDIRVCDDPECMAAIPLNNVVATTMDLLRESEGAA